MPDRRRSSSARSRSCARRRGAGVEQLHARGETDAYLYGAEPTEDYSALNAFFLLKDAPGVYNLPEAPQRPAAHLRANYLFSFGASLALTLASALIFKRGR